MPSYCPRVFVTDLGSGADGILSINGANLDERHPTEDRLKVSGKLFATPKHVALH
jgi:hypothetical protein